MLALLGHAAAGGALTVAAALLLVSASIVVFVAAAELGLGRWAFVCLAGGVQVAGHFLLSTLHAGHATAGYASGHAQAHAYGSPAAAPVGMLEGPLQHLLSGQGAWMVPLHVLAFAAIALAVTLAAPLARAVARLVQPLLASPMPPRFDTGHVPFDVLADRATSLLACTVSRRGPPAFV